MTKAFHHTGQPVPAAVRRIHLPDAEATRTLGAGLGRRLLAGLNRWWRPPLLITLAGDLGAGKTTFSQGLAQGLEVAPGEEVVSPTFTLANEYQAAVPIFHLDLYRLEPDEFHEAGLDEHLEGPGVILVEWPERLPERYWSEAALRLSLAWAPDGGRDLALDSGHEHFINLIEAIRHDL